MIEPRIVAGLGVLALLTVSPGADMALVATVTLRRGRPACDAVRRWLERVTGLVLVGLGLRFAFDRR